MQVKANWLLAALISLALWPSVAAGQSTELLEAHKRSKALFQQGRYAEAEQLYQRALEIYRDTLGAKHPPRCQQRPEPSHALLPPGPLRRGRAIVSERVGDVPGGAWRRPPDRCKGSHQSGHSLPGARTIYRRRAGHETRAGNPPARPRRGPSRHCPQSRRPSQAVP